MSKQTKAFSADVTVSDGERAVVARISTDAIDRDSEVLIPQGMNSKDFEKNPIVFLSHAYYTLPVGKVVSLKRGENDITAKVVFADRPATHPAGEEWIADTLLSLFQQGVLKGFSVGFTVKESRPATDKDVMNYGAGVKRVISKWQLLELSVAPLPCNQEAVALAVSKGQLSPELAKGMFGIEQQDDVTAYGIDADQKSSPKMAKCSVCEKEYAVDDMNEDDGSYICKGCAEKKSAKPKRLVYYVDPPAPVDHGHIVAKAAAKARGALYFI